MDPWLELDLIHGLEVEVGISSPKISLDSFTHKKSNFLHTLLTIRNQGFLIRHGGRRIR